MQYNRSTVSERFALLFIVRELGCPNRSDAGRAKLLGSLIREKPYDEIVVQEILDRANVGRSTFYMHFGDKDDLFVSAIHDMLGPVQTPMEAASESIFKDNKKRSDRFRRIFLSSTWPQPSFSYWICG